MSWLEIVLLLMVSLLIPLQFIIVFLQVGIERDLKHVQLEHLSPMYLPVNKIAAQTPMFHSFRRLVEAVSHDEESSRKFHMLLTEARHIIDEARGELK